MAQNDLGGIDIVQVLTSDDPKECKHENVKGFYYDTKPGQWHECPDCGKKWEKSFSTGEEKAGTKVKIEEECEHKTGAVAVKQDKLLKKQEDPDITGDEEISMKYPIVIGVVIAILVSHVLFG